MQTLEESNSTLTHLALKEFQADVSQWLERFSPPGWTVAVHCIDLLRDANADLSDDSTWAKVLSDIQDTQYDILLCSPPCSSWSRACYCDHLGPRPVRSREHPCGYPWLRPGSSDYKRAALGSLLVQRALQACQAIHDAGGLFLLEHPEDLGARLRGDPASIWQLEQTAKLAKATGAKRVAMHQCAFGGESAKPTGFLGTLVGMTTFGFEGWPRFTRSRFHYLGPLPAFCGHRHEPLQGKDEHGAWKSTAAAAYSSGLCKAIAERVWASLPVLTGRGSVADKDSTATEQAMDNDQATADQRKQESESNEAKRIIGGLTGRLQHDLERTQKHSGRLQASCRGRKPQAGQQRAAGAAAGCKKQASRQASKQATASGCNKMRQAAGKQERHAAS